MKLPNGQQALVEDAKLLGYVLNAHHPVGRNHARLFRELLGIDASKVDRLRSALHCAAMEADVHHMESTPFGQKFDIRFELDGPKGSKIVRSVWILEDDAARPRLVTCFVE